jgi:phage terminase Nu1 subunit (DNA packaging protein)
LLAAYAINNISYTKQLKMNESRDFEINKLGNEEFIAFFSWNSIAGRKANVLDLDLEKPSGRSIESRARSTKQDYSDQAKRLKDITKAEDMRSRRQLMPGSEMAILLASSRGMDTERYNLTLLENQSDKLQKRKREMNKAVAEFVEFSNKTLAPSLKRIVKEVEDKFADDKEMIPFRIMRSLQKEMAGDPYRATRQIAAESDSNTIIARTVKDARSNLEVMQTAVTCMESVVRIHKLSSEKLTSFQTSRLHEFKSAVSTDPALTSLRIFTEGWRGEEQSWRKTTKEIKQILDNSQNEATNGRNRRDVEEKESDTMTKLKALQAFLASSQLGVTQSPQQSNRGECFDYKDGKCMRGASCRFLHNGKAAQDDPQRQKVDEKSKTDKRSRSRSPSNDSKSSTGTGIGRSQNFGPSKKQK